MKSLVVLLAAMLNATSPQQFDLLCAGGFRLNASSPWQPRATHFRVDLTTNRWCEAECKAIHQLAEVQPGSIWFEKETAEESARGIIRYRAVNRETGEYRYTRMSGRSWFESKGTCQPATFSGFPDLQTKF